MFLRRNLELGMTIRFGFKTLLKFFPDRSFAIRLLILKFWIFKATGTALKVCFLYICHTFALNCILNWLVMNSYHVFFHLSLLYDFGSFFPVCGLDWHERWCWTGKRARPWLALEACWVNTFRLFDIFCVISKHNTKVPVIIYVLWRVTRGKHFWVQSPSQMFPKNNWRNFLYYCQRPFNGIMAII